MTTPWIPPSRDPPPAPSDGPYFVEALTAANEPSTPRKYWGEHMYGPHLVEDAGKAKRFATPEAAGEWAEARGGRHAVRGLA